MKRAIGWISALLMACAAPAAAPLATGMPLVPMPLSPASAAGSWRLTPDAPFRASEPPPGETPFFVPPRVEKQALSNGIPLYIASRPGGQIATFAVAAIGVPDDRNVSRAMTRFVAEGLDLGAGQATQGQLRTNLANLLGREQIEDREDSASVHFVHHSKYTEQILDLVADLVQRPTFPQNQVDFLRNRVSHAASRKLETAAYGAFRVFRLAVFGPDYSYTPDRTLTPSQCSALTREAVVKAWRASFIPGKIALVAAGDVDASRLVPKLESTFGTWKDKRDPKNTVLPGTPRAGTTARLVVIDTPGASQATLFFGRTGPAWKAPDFPAVALTRTLLNGSSSSPLERRLRQELNLSYDGGLQLWNTREPGLLFWSGKVPGDRVAEALREISQQVDRVSTESPSAESLALARRRTRFWTDESLETSETLADALIDLAALEVDETEPAQYQDRVDAVTPADVLRVGKAWFDSAHWRAVIAGDWKGLRDQLLKLGWGAVERRDASGRLLTTES